MEIALRLHCIAERTFTPPHGKKSPPPLQCFLKEDASSIILVGSHTPNQSELQKIRIGSAQAAVSQEARRMHVSLKTRAVLKGSWSVPRQRRQHTQGSRSGACCLFLISKQRHVEIRGETAWKDAVHGARMDDPAL